jgi:hypothetical protein
MPTNKDNAFPKITVPYIRTVNFEELEEISEITGLSENIQLAIIKRECCISNRNLIESSTSLSPVVIQAIIDENSETTNFALVDSNLLNQEQLIVVKANLA